MLGALFRRAQATVDATVDTAIEHAVNRVLVVTPFLVAAGFGTAALTLWLTRELGAESATLIMAGLFTIVGIAAVVALHWRSPTPHVAAAEEETEAEKSAAESGDSPKLEAADRELLMSMLTTAAPVALPTLMRVIVRNLPLLAAIAISIFILTRPAQDERDPEAEHRGPDEQARAAS